MGGHQPNLSSTQPPQDAGVLYPSAPTHTAPVILPNPVSPIVQHPIEMRGAGGLTATPPISTAGSGLGQFKGPSLGGLGGMGTFHTNPVLIPQAPITQSAPIPQPSLPQPTNPGGLTVQHPIEMRPQRG